MRKVDTFVVAIIMSLTHIADRSRVCPAKPEGQGDWNMEGNFMGEPPAQWPNHEYLDGASSNRPDHLSAERLYGRANHGRPAPDVCAESSNHSATVR